MKYTFIILFVLLQVACSSIPPKDGEVTYTEISEASIEINNIKSKYSGVHNVENIHSNLRKGINEKWPDLKFISNTDKHSPEFYIDILVYKYNAKYDMTRSEETISNKKVHYKTYMTKTWLRFKYNVNNKITNKTVWSKEVKTENIRKNKIEDTCYSSSFFEELLCEVVIEPIVDGTINLLLSPLKAPDDVPDKLYKPAMDFEDIFYQAGKDIGNSLPGPICSTDGYSTCVAHFFRNTLGF